MAGTLALFAESVDAWTEYQAARIKLHVDENGLSTLRLLETTGQVDKALAAKQAAEYEADIKKYEGRSKETRAKAERLEAEYERLNFRDDQFDMSDVFLSIAVAVSAVDVRLEGPIGTRVYAPVETSDLKRDYDISIGDLRLDLSNAALAAGDTEVDANVGIGELTVIVPENVALDVDASASAGEVTVFGRSESGVDADLSESIPARGSNRTLRIDAHVGLGDVIVETP